MTNVPVCGNIYPLPDLSNECNNMGDTKTVTNWVSSVSSSQQGTQQGPAPSFVNTFAGACNLIGSPGEWIWSGQQSPLLEVNYIASNTDPNTNIPIMIPISDYNQHTECFGDVGYLEKPYGNLICTRSTFTGDPLDCCLNNQSCSGSCYSDTDNMKTCAPEFRNQYSSGCESFMIDFCSGNSPSSYYTSSSTQFSEPWMNEWIENGTCLNYFRNKLFTPPNLCVPYNPTGTLLSPCNYDYSPAIYDAEGIFITSSLMDQVFKTYSKNYELGASIDSNQYNVFEQYLFDNICCKYSGVCDFSLNNQCITKTVDDLIESNSLSLWCGCHLSDNYYNEFGIAYNLPKECTPMCSKQGVIHNGDTSTGTAALCTSNVCLINKTTIDLIDSTVGNLEFQQLCSSCIGATCSCIISGNTIDIANSTIDGTFIPIQNGCNNLTCNMQSNNGTTSNNCVDTQTNLEDYYSKFEGFFGIYNVNSLLLNLGIGIGLLFIVFVLVIIAIPLTSYFKNKNS